jgi:hypothetical protein
MRREQALPRLIGISVANAPQGPQSEVRRGDAGMEGVVPGQTGASEQRVHSMGADRWALDRRTVLTRAVAGVTCLSNPSDAGAVAIRVKGEGGWDMTPPPFMLIKNVGAASRSTVAPHTPTIRTGAP